MEQLISPVWIITGWAAPLFLLGQVRRGTEAGQPAHSNFDFPSENWPSPALALAWRHRDSSATSQHHEEGEAHYRKALALAEPRGMRPVIAHCHSGLSKLYQRTGKREQAREHLATATSMYREMDMRFYLEQAEAEQ